VGFKSKIIESTKQMTTQVDTIQKQKNKSKQSTKKSGKDPMQRELTTMK
jgi:hypothetical protein